MKRNLIVRSLALTISLLLGFLPVQAAERPFSWNGSGSSTFFTDASGNLAANITVSGTATYLGLWTATGTVHFTPDPDPSHPGRFLSSAALAVIAANGDTLNIELHGDLDPAAGMDTGPIQFVGGTGRFVGASGSGQFVVELNPATGAFKTTVVGKINF